MSSEDRGSGKETMRITQNLIQEEQAEGGAPHDSTAAFGVEELVSGEAPAGGTRVDLGDRFGTAAYRTAEYEISGVSLSGNDPEHDTASPEGTETSSEQTAEGSGSGTETEDGGNTEAISKATVRIEDLAAEQGKDKDQDEGQEGESQDEASADDQAEEDASADDQAQEDEEEKKPEVDEETRAIKKKIRERRREKKRKARRRRARFWTILSILLFSIAAFIFSLSGFFTVDLIEVQGNSHFTAEEIINIAHAVPGHNLIYDSGSEEIIEYLEQNPYIKSAAVTRKFPSTLLITVVEREEACAFKYDDDYLIMDDEGTLLKKTRTEPKITMVKGLVVTKLKLGDTVGTEDKRMFSRLLRLIRATKEADLYFVRIDMSEYAEDSSVKAYIYNKLIVRSEYDMLYDALKDGRLHKVVENLFDDSIKRGTITISTDGSISFKPGI